MKLSNKKIYYNKQKVVQQTISIPIRIIISLHICYSISGKFITLRTVAWHIMI